jgi:hypothetical protein
MMKKVLLASASIFLMWQSHKLLGLIGEIRMDSWGILVFFARAINLFITGVFAFAGFAFPTQKILPKGYYQISRPKSLKRLYKLLGVSFFRQLLLLTLWRSKQQRAKHFDGKKAGIENLIVQSQKSEFGHLLPFIIVNLVCIYMLALELFDLALASFLINIIGNLYPIILQRHHRMRIQIIERRFGANAYESQVGKQIWLKGLP